MSILIIEKFCVSKGGISVDSATIGSISGYVRSVVMTETNNAPSKISEGRANRDSANFSELARKSVKSAESAPEKTESTEEKSIVDALKEQSKRFDSLFAEQEYDKSRDTRLSGIKAKIHSGQTLSLTEQSYLAIRDPESYKSFQRTESARRVYRCTLMSCRTRDEVNGMRLSNALSALSAYKKAIRNGGDGAEIAGLNAALDREIREFTRTRNYQSLPTVAECNKFDRDLAKARKFEQEKRIAERKNRLKKRKKQVKTPGDGKQTVRQVMSSPTAKKVIGSRAKRICSAYHGEMNFYQKMNRKI